MVFEYIAMMQTWWHAECQTRWSVHCQFLFCILWTWSCHHAIAAEPVNFNRDVRPILSDRCFFCHGPDSHHREAELRLDLEEAAKENVIVPGKPAASEFMARILSSDADLVMPPLDSGKKLSDSEKQLLQRWVEEGAVYQPAWAYVPPRRHPLPQIKESSWALTPIDTFIFSKLEKQGLTPSAPANRATLIRRLSLDLIGLPPTPAEVTAFETDTSANAYEKVVDRLLASEHFGERMAMYWLDLVRFADTVGYHGDQEHHISPYRDYVINAFNQNLPFDQFTREQLAGDLIADSTQQQKIASGYNRLLQTTHEGGLQIKEYLAIYGADRVRNLSIVWMGATMGCCQCHDHKYDPFTIKEFYALQSFFADIDEDQHLKRGRDVSPTIRYPEMELPTPEQVDQIEALKTQIAELKVTKESPKEIQAQQKVLTAELGKVQASVLRCMVTQAIPPRPIRVLPRGNWQDDSGEIVTPGVPSVLGSLKARGEQPDRLDLANWLTDPTEGAGGLTARVIVNRFWYLLFGIGLSKSLEDFGGQGEAPVHPELLDRLAIEFYESNWNVKAILKQMVMSRTYQQASVYPSEDILSRDPENRYYSRQTAFRLPAETIRDQALAVSGLLVPQVLGRSVRPAQPAMYYRNLNFPKREYQPDTDDQQWRRGVYMHWQRQYLHPSLKAFDAPSREECTAERPRSNTPSAALVLLNDPNFVEAARSFAARILKSPDQTDAVRIENAFRLALSRGPDAVEADLLQQLLKESRVSFQKDPQAAARLIAVGQAKTGRDLDACELAAWMQVTRALLNTNEIVTRN